jgi:hypothetical protein
MTTRCNPIIRATVFLMFVLTLWSIPSGMSAQCACNYYTFTLDPTVTCDVTICWAVSPVGVLSCETIAPGQSLRIPCPVYEAYIRLCNGSLYTIIGNTPGARCTGGLVVAPFCCVRACWTVDGNNCPLIQITPWNCAGGGC